MKKIVKKIKEKYVKYLTEEEKDTLDFADKEELLVIINKIWDAYLNENVLIHKLSSSLSLLKDLNELLNSNEDGFMLISRDSLKEGLLPAGLCGFICHNVKINKLLLPNDCASLKRGDISYFPRAVLCVNIGEKELGSSYETAKDFADEYSLNFMSVISKNIKEEDYINMVKDILAAYLLKKGKASDLELRDRLISKYQKQIISLFRKEKDLEDFNAIKLEYIIGNLFDESLGKYY